MSVRSRLHAALDRPGLHHLAATVPPARAVARRLATRADGSPALTSGPVRWEGLDFEFTAPLRSHRSARTRGIENIICRILRTGVAPGATVVDVGASYGFVTMVAALTVGPAGKVISAEHDPVVAAALRGTVADNGVGDRVRVVEATVGPPGQEITVDELAADDDRLAFLKVDTDGLDLGILEGAVAAVERHRPVLVVELTADEAEIVGWLGQRYGCVVDQFGREILGSPWPANAVALTRRPGWLDDCWRPPRRD